MYESQEITSINVLFTHFVNSVTFEPEMIKLLPVEEDFAKTEEALCRNDFRT
jgi:F-type H+-transporting ATPase subunit gamma